MRKELFPIILLTLLLSCEKSATENNFTSFQGTWQFNYTNGFADPHNYTIDSKNEFAWKDSSLVTDYSVRPPISVKVYFNVVGSVSNTGELSAGIFLLDSQTKSGTFTGKMTDKDGSGSYTYNALQTDIFGTWTATKK